jgi:hypothetical protein
VTEQFRVIRDGTRGDPRGRPDPEAVVEVLRELAELRFRAADEEVLCSSSPPFTF